MIIFLFVYLHSHEKNRQAETTTIYAFTKSVQSKFRMILFCLTLKIKFFKVVAYCRLLQHAVFQSVNTNQTGF